ncbi:MAG: ribose 5-phosphate isomerase B [Dehalococcoidia bacterium]|nr:ribose 5-phosphate isomerase B [Dehalococcoidia bacterium]
MIVGVGCDHRGVEMKAHILALLGEMGHTACDCGADGVAGVDYPDIARELCVMVADGRLERGILICGTGIGMSISANKVKGIRAALCFDEWMARRSRQHNNANVLCVGAEKTTGVAEIVRSFLNTQFEGGRHQRRLEKLTGIENG